MIFTAIGATLFGAGSLLAGVSAAALQIAAGIAINYFVAGLNGQPEQQYAGMQGQLQVGADVSRTVPLGLNLAEHSLVYANYWGASDGTPNAYLSQVFCAADYPVKGLHEIHIDGARVTLLADDGSGKGRPVSEYQRDGQNYAWVKFYDGTQTVADPFLVATFSGHPERPYGSNRVGYGCPYIVLTTRVHEELWSGFPTVKIVLDGARFYDISRDSTRGGTGSQRANNPATWGGDGDYLTAVQAYALLMGIRFNGQWLYGLQSLPAAQLPDAWWIAQINACRATVTGLDGPEPTYRSGGSINVSRPISETMQRLTTACQGRLVEAGGEYRLHVGGAQSPVYHITDGDVLSTEERRFVPFFGLAETINGIAASHPSPENGWNSLPLPTLLRPDLEVIDGDRRLLADVSLDLVPYEWQAQRVMQQALAEARRERKLTLVLPGAFYLALPGEWISFTSADNGFIDKLFRIDGVADKANGDVMWDITEIDPADYDPDFGTYTPPVVGSLLPGNVPPQEVSGFYAEGVLALDDQGRPRRPAIDAYWDAQSVEDDVRAVRITIFLPDALSPEWEGEAPKPKAGSARLTQALIHDTYYDVQIEYRPFSGRPTVVSSRFRVKTPFIQLTSLDVALDDIADEVAEKVAELDEWARYNTRETIEEKRKAILLNVAGAVGDYNDRQHIRREAASGFQTSKAQWTEDILVATGPTSALALRIEELQAEVFDPISGLSAVASAVNLLSAEVNDPGTGLEAVGNAILSLVSSVPGASAEGLLRIFTSAAPGGVAARVALSVAASAGAAPAMAALYMDTDGSTAEILLVANRVAAVTGPAGTKYGIFVIDGGVVWMDEARIRNLTAANVQTRSLTADKLVAGTLTSAEINVQQLVASNAFLTYLRVGNAQIDDLSVDRLKIADGAVTDMVTFADSGSSSTGTLTFDGPTFVATSGPWIEAATINTGRNTGGATIITLQLIDVAAGTVVASVSATNSMAHGTIRQATGGRTYRYRITAFTNWDGSSGTWTINFTQGISLWRK